MRFLHMADLHIGKNVNGFSMIEDQRYILKKIIEIVDANEPKGVFISGDVYDKNLPGIEAVRLLDWFLSELSNRVEDVFIISGNHDSADRLSFGSSIMNNSGVHFSAPMEVTLHELKCGINVYMLPFIKPIYAKVSLENPNISTYEEGVKEFLNKVELKEGKVNILLAHQFVTGAEISDSEERSLGGIDNISAEVFDDFDYVALGHIHKPQKIHRNTLRYAGSPLKYSFSEARFEKSVTLVDVIGKNNIKIKEIPLKPIRDLREIKGNFKNILEEGRSCGGSEDYVHIILVDEDEHFNALEELRQVYPNIMKLDYDNTRTRSNLEIDFEIAENVQDPMELVQELFEKQNGQKMNCKQEEYLRKIIDEIWEDRV